MSNVNLPAHPDVVMIYQDRESVEPAIRQIIGLGLEFKAYKFNPRTLHQIVVMKPKVLLLASSNVKNTIEYYINYLEDYQQHIAQHSAILLINNRETSRAYLACENGLFDDYVIINPLNEPHRLTLVLLRELKLLNNHHNNSLEQLISEGEDEIAACIEHGVNLKRTFLDEVNSSEKKILSATNKILGNEETKDVLQKLIGLSLEQMNENVVNSIQDIVEQLEKLKENNQSIKKNLKQQNAPKSKTGVGMNVIDKMAAGDTDQSTRHKVLIAESSDLFTQVIDDIFEQTVFEYILVKDGQVTLDTIRSFKPDVILLAYDLPTLNGIEITQIIRNEGNSVPIIAYVQPKDQMVIKRWIPLGLSSYLIKPSKKSYILQSVAKAIQDPVNIIFSQKSDAKIQIQWIPEYSVGNAELDEQHKVLFSMVNDFLHQDNKQAAISLFQNLSSYIDLHFDAEESLLRQINYPDTQEHIKGHTELRNKFHLLEAKLDNYSVDIHHKIAMFLYNWLSQHILKADMEYKHYAVSIEEPSFNI